MLSEEDHQIALELRSRLSAITPLIDFRLFGSRARGDATQESDMDVFVVVDHLWPELREIISEVAWEVGFDNERVITTIVTTPEQLANGPMGANPLILEIERDGIRP